MPSKRIVVLLVVSALAAFAPAVWSMSPKQAAAAPATVFRGARLVSGQGTVIAESGILVVRHGRIAAVGAADAIVPPADAVVIDLAGRTVIPGLINAHGHVADTIGLEANPRFYTESNLLRQLRLYAQYGVTTVVSLGGDGEAGRQLRDGSVGPLDRARLRIAGPVVTATSPEAARQEVDRVAALQPDFIKIRVDDNLGTTRKMPLEAARAVIEQAHARGIRVAAHIFYLEDAKALIRAGADFIAHSVRDQAVDDELVELMKARNLCLSPTLTRELSTFVYETEPDFFSDPFFLNGVESSVVAALRDPARRNRTPSSDIAYRYKAALDEASANVKRLHDAGVEIAMGTDTGPPGRFQGYFEHLEMELMVRAGLSPSAVLRTATAGAASCVGLPDAGDLAVGRWADFVVLTADPRADIRGTRAIESVWVGGQEVR